MPQSPNSLLDQVISTKESVEKNLEDIPYAVRAGFASRQQEAIGELPKLLLKLQKDVVPNRLVGVIASGDAQAVEQAANLLAANGGIVLDAAELYRGAAIKIEPTFSTDFLFRTNQHMGVVIHCETIAKELGLSGVAIEYLEGFCRNYGEILAHVRRMVRASVGDRLQAMYLARAATMAVVAGKLGDPKIPVMVVNSIEDELPALRGLFAKSCAHAFEPTTEEFTKESMTAILKTAS